MAWPVVCQPKDRGGLGVVDLEVVNKWLLGRWLWKLENEEGPWQVFLKEKYLSQCKCVAAYTPKPSDSQFWKDIPEIKDIFYGFYRRLLRNGQNTRFWEDICLGNSSLSDQYPRLYALTFSKNIMIASVWRRLWVWGLGECCGEKLWLCGKKFKTNVSIYNFVIDQTVCSGNLAQKEHF